MTDSIDEDDVDTIDGKIPAGTMEEDKIRDYLNQRFRDDVMSARAKDAFAERIADKRARQESGGGIGPGDFGGDWNYDPDEGEWKRER